jgi:four helix bundle protein
MDRFELERRTKRFALRVIAFVDTLPKSKAGEVIEYQLVKAGTSIGSNYREANRAESRNDFIHKIGIVEKESSESCYWLELCDEADFGDRDERHWLLQESRELLAIFTSTSRTSKRNRARSRN